jgi:hypothetical protein
MATTDTTTRAERARLIAAQRDEGVARGASAPNGVAPPLLGEHQGGGDGDDWLMPGKLLFLRADTIATPDYQRGVQGTRVRRMAANLDPRLLGVLLVAFRDGRYHVIDGQHRLAAVIHAGHGARALRCLALEVASYREEAELFVTGNARDNTKPLTTGQQFHARLEQGDKTAHAIKAICDGAGVTLDLMMNLSTSAADTIRAVATLDRIYRNGGPDHLADVIATIVDIFPHDREALIHGVLLGFHQFLWRYHALADRAVLRNALRNLTLDGLNARAMMAKAAGWRKRTDSGLLIGQTILDVYNDQRQARNRLPTWAIVPGPRPVRHIADTGYLARPDNAIYVRD